MPSGMAATMETDSGADQIVESVELLTRLGREGALRGRVYRQLCFPPIAMERADFRGATLDRVSLGEAELGRGDFSGVTIRHSNLQQARLDGFLAVGLSIVDSDLTAASMRNAHLERVELQRGVTMNLALQGARLSRVRLAATNLYGLRGSGALFLHCAFVDPAPHGSVELTRAQLDGATLVECDLRGANLYRANLQGALLVRCNLSRAVLTAAETAGARLVACDVSGAELPDELRQRVSAQGAEA